MNRPSQSPTMQAAFSSLQIPAYKILWWGGLFSFLSVQAQFLLRGLLAWDLTERDGALGLVYLMFGLSLLVATPLGGVAADRFPKRTVLLISQFTIMSAAVGMGLVVVFDVERFWMLLVAALMQGGAFGFLGPTRMAFSAELVGRDQLGNAIALSMLSMNGTRVFAPALAGILAGVAFIGIGGAYLLAGLASATSFWYLWRLPRLPAANAGRSNPFVDIIDGVRYVRSDTHLRRLVIASFFVIMFGFNYVVFLPPLVEGTFGLSDTWVGIISSASALGAVAVSIPLAALADGPRARPIMVASGVAFGVFVLALAAAPNFWVAFAVVMLIGAATTAFQSLSNTLALTTSSDAMQGRVQSLMMLSFAGFGIAAAPLGGLAELIGRRWVIAIMGLVAMAAMAIYIVAERITAAQGQSDSAVDPISVS